MKIITLTKEEDFLHYQGGLEKLEKSILYPMGDEYFYIDHGKYYADFFKRIGQVTSVIGVKGTLVVASLTGIYINEQGEKYWYFCDLKVHPGFRGEKLSQRLFRHFLPSIVKKSLRGYSISMNPSFGENKVLSTFEKLSRLSKFKFFQIKNLGHLNFYLLSFAEVEIHQEKISEFFGNFHFVNIEKLKSLRLLSSGQNIKMLHAQFKDLEGSDNENDNEYLVGPHQDYGHLFSLTDFCPAKKYFDENFKKWGQASLVTFDVFPWRKPLLLKKLLYPFDTSQL